jgi:hypothetical protein
MPYSYIALADAPSGTTDAQIARACTLINTALDRSEGLVYGTDSFGRPSYMLGSDPDASYALSAPVAPGQSVVIGFPFPSYDLIGDVLILDRADANLCEAVTISGVNPQAGTITLAQVLRAHAAGAVLDQGLLITEERSMPSGRSIAQVSRPQLARLVGAAGRYGYGRRSDQFGGYADELNMLAALQTLGAEQTWQPIDAANVSIKPITGECWITPGLLLAYFSEVRLRYVAGFPANAIPAAVKEATLNVLANMATGEEMNPIYKVVQAGGTKMERFSSSFIDDDTKSMLSSYKRRVFV